MAPNKGLFPEYARRIVIKYINKKLVKISESTPKILHCTNELFYPQTDFTKVIKI